VIVNASKRALILLPVTGWIKVRHTPVLGELPPPKYDVTKGFMAMVKNQERSHLALICMSLDRNAARIMNA
jgi:hypothetical protein